MSPVAPRAGVAHSPARPPCPPSRLALPTVQQPLSAAANRALRARRHGAVSDRPTPSTSPPTPYPQQRSARSPALQHKPPPARARSSSGCAVHRRSPPAHPDTVTSSSRPPTHHPHRQHPSRERQDVTVREPTLTGSDHPSGRSPTVAAPYKQRTPIHTKPKNRRLHTRFPATTVQDRPPFKTVTARTRRATHLSSPSPSIS